MTSRSALALKPIENRILFVRGQRILLDSDLAALYEVEVRALNQAVKRNKERFPSDFVFPLTPEENEALKSQTVISKNSRGGRRYLPYVFTEHGAIMAASVLNSRRAVKMSIFVVRAFLRQREALSTSKALAAKLAQLEQRLGTHDHIIDEIVRAIRALKVQPEKPARQIGFRPHTPPGQRCWRPVRAWVRAVKQLNEQFRENRNDHRSERESSVGSVIL
jgi:hypothetical protein